MGYLIFQANTDDNPVKTNLLVNHMMNIGVDGIIFSSVRFDDEEIIKKLIDEGIPVVMANRRLRENVGDYVVIDNEYGAHLAVSHLINLGRRRIAMIKGTENTSTGLERFQGYMKALKESGLNIDDDLIKSGTFNEESGYEWTRKIMRQSRTPDAIFCADDEIALGAISALEELGYSVPKDVAVIGFDDSRISSHHRIQLTTVSQDIRKMAMTALDIMLRRIEDPGRENEQIVLQPNLTIRHTCGFQDRNT